MIARTKTIRTRSFLGWMVMIALVGGCLVHTTGSEVLRVQAKAVVMDPEQPERTRFGALTLLSSFVLEANDKRFGGLSGLALNAAGDTLFAVTDRGYGLSARLIHDKTGRLTGIEQWAMTPLKTPSGEPVKSRMIDAEAIVQERDGGWLVAFENRHRIWRYPPSPTPFAALPEPLQVPRALSRAPRNGGLESMTRLPDGRLLALTEEFENEDGSLKGWLISPEGAFDVSYLASDGFSPTDMAALSQGDILVLERRFRRTSGVAIRLRRIAGHQLQPGARLQGRELASFHMPLVIDNFEGLAVRELPQGDILLYLISDDNFNFFQQTLLSQFRLDRSDLR
ncbi:esterase-like activity of phytase family protein [Candidatus Entotheonella palauensis]|nr:esterase-like activity of phytase family protein [Candidatus Entotheonella palauensis]